MNSKQAQEKLKQINKQRNTIGVGRYKDSKRSRCEQHDKFNTAMNEMEKLSDQERMKEVNDD